MKYPRPPITEAVLDIRVDPRADLDVEELRGLKDSAPAYFKTINDQFNVVASLKLGQTTTQQLTPEKKGFQFVAEEQKKLFQAQTDGFAFNKLAPYEGWESFSPEAKDLWTAYRSLAKPKSIKRLALRYINRLDLPIPFSDFNEYILIVPDVAPGLPQALSNFFMQVQIPHPEIKTLAIINVAMAGPANPAVCSITLDIDVVRQFECPQDEAGIWELFEALRTTKNKIFEECTTDAMKGRFK